MVNSTYKRHHNRKRSTRRVQQGGVFGIKSFTRREGEAKHEGDRLTLEPNEDKLIGVLISIKSLKSSNQKIKGTPYVVIVPSKAGPKYAYGSTADNAVKNAMNHIFDDSRHVGDTYTGTAVSYKSLYETDPKKKRGPYVISVPSANPADPTEYYGTTPANAVAKAAQTNASAVLGRMGVAARGAFSRKPAATTAPAPVAPAPAAAPAPAPAAAPAPP